MAIEPVGFLPALHPAGQAAPADAASGAFGPWLAQALGSVNDQLLRADNGLQRLATGDAESLHQVMISLEEARIGLQLVVQVRNRLLEAYQDVLRMQV
jgi:flagellar hook-basal body complex protein FliE